MSNNARFLNAYNRLDYYLRSLVHVRGNLNMISYLEKILPERLSAECRTVRQFKNLIESHGVNPQGRKPEVPEEWIQWLLNQLEWCKQNQQKIAPRLQQALDSSRRPSSQGAGRTSPPANRSPARQPPAPRNKGYAVYLVSPDGTGGYFAGYWKRTIWSTVVRRERTVATAQVYPSREAAMFVIAEIQRKCPEYHITLVEVPLK